MSIEGLHFLVGWEGFKQFASLDQGGKLDIGYGHLLSDEERKTGEIVLPNNRVVYWTNGITEAEARDIMRADLAKAEAVVAKTTKSNTLEQHEFDALVAFVFDVGIRAFETSTMLRRLSGGNVEGALEAWAWFDKVTKDGIKQVSEGLRKRRKAEIALFEKADYGGRP
jgi:lysozyme